jgi:hypothetical protein
VLIRNSKTNPDKYPLPALRRQFDFWGGVPMTLFCCPTLNEKYVEESLKGMKIAEAMRCLATYDVNH